MKRAAFFDMDGTLMALPSSERRFIAELWTRRQLNWRRVSLSAVFLLMWLPRFGRDVARKNKAYLSGLKVAQIEALARPFAVDLAKEVPPVMREAIGRHRELGDITVLLTGSPYFIAEPLGQLLGFDHVIATQPTVHNGEFSWLPPGQHPMGRQKLELAESFCARHGLSLANAAAYGDSRLDMDLLQRVGRPVAVRPDSSLQQAAERNDWTILDH